MTTVVKFPHTPHICWLSSGSPREDKVLSEKEARELLSETVVLEEKIDGANLGFSVDDQGNLRARNRGNWLDSKEFAGQWKPLKRWLASRSERNDWSTTREEDLVNALGQDLILFGEWCYAVHSTSYTKLPDLFVVFDVYDRVKGEFWSVDRRNALAQSLGLSVVPEIKRGRFTLNEIKGLLGQSALTEGPAEGLYIRCEDNGHLVQRAKLVRAEFVQAININEHWSKKGIETNRIL